MTTKILRNRVTDSEREPIHFRIHDPNPVQAAQSIRRKWGFAGRINTKRLLQSVVDRVLWSPDSLWPVSAQTIRTETGHLVTILNSAERRWIGRMRWTKAHEALHVILGHFELDDDDEQSLCDQADQIVAELLLPNEQVMDFVRQHTAGPGILPREIGHLKRHFVVSWRAAIRRLDALGIQPLAVSQTLMEWLHPRSGPALVSLQDPVHIEALRILKQRGLQL